QVLMLSQRAPYPGWTAVEPTLHEGVQALFSSFPEVQITRLGLRYSNAFNPEDHGIRSLADLDVSVVVSEETILERANLNYNTSVGDLNSTTRIATPEFVQGPLPPNTSVFADVDVYTKENFRTVSQAVVGKWIGISRATLKTLFFSLLTEQKIQELKE